MKKYIAAVIVLATILLTGCNEKLTVQQKIAKKYGIDQFSKVETIEYTWNVTSKRGSASRFWRYNPNTQEVFYKNEKEEKTWKRSDIPKDLKSLDGDFINDQYWVLFPFHLLWDPGVIFVTGLKKTAPLAKKEYNWLRIAYPKDLGYTPGDAYELYYDDELTIHEWSYHSKGEKKASLATSWEKPKTVEGITYATEFNNDSGFKLWISDLKINLKK
ncbi:MAG: hypothetical protein KC646_03755 [Candidatus Cloacimonetes bacterium]|nr:hypothetical protein [Candidatus Cloacimonadota bacterium]